MYFGMLLAAGGGGGLTDVNGWTMVWAWAAFLVTFWALSKIAWPMLQAKMEEREVRIREGLEKADEAERRAQDLLEKQEAVLQEAREEAQKLLAESRATAANIKNETIQAAQTEIAEERDRAKKEIDLERSRAIDELRRAAVDLTLQAAGAVIERELKDEDHRRLAAQVIGEMDDLK
jgi:F-type H+-transporting ATPase subunit b